MCCGNAAFCQITLTTCDCGCLVSAPIRFEAYQSQHGDIASHHSAMATVATGNNAPTLLPRATHTLPNAVVMNGRVQPHHGREPPLQIVNRKLSLDVDSSNGDKGKEKVKVGFLYSATYTKPEQCALQSRKWQLIGKRQWCCPR